MALDEEEEPMPRNVTLDQRLSLVERDVRGHARSLTGLNINYSSTDKRITALEEWKMAVMIAGVRNEEQDKNTAERLGRIEKSISSINEGFKKAFWMIAGAVLVAMLPGLAMILVLGPKMASLL